MKNRGNILILMLIIVACVAVWIEYYVSGGKPFVNIASGKSGRSYHTFQEHLAQKEREKRMGELTSKFKNFFFRT